MDLRTIASLSPLMRVGIASAPIFAALMARLLLGDHRGLRLILMGSTTWLAMNVMVSSPL